MTTRKLKVLQVIHALNFGGAENVVVDLATRSDPAEVETEVCCINRLGPLAERLKTAGVEVIQLDKGDRQGYLAVSRALKKLIRERQPDVVHTHGDVALIDIGPAYVAGRPSAPLVHTYHFGNYPHIKRRYLYAQALYSQFADQLVAVSDNQRQAVMKHMMVRSGRIRTILNGVTDHPEYADPERVARKREELGLAPTDLVLGTICVLTRQKGVTYLLQAARGILKRHPELKILIVGGGRLLEPLKAEAEALGLPEQNLIFTGWRKDAKEILPALDLFILPSLWEAMPIVLLEAMAAGRPTIATDVGDNARVLTDGETGRIIPPQSPSAIEAAVCELIEQPELRTRLGLAAYRDYGQRLTVDHMVRSYQEIYRRLADRAAGPAPVGRTAP